MKIKTDKGEELLLERSTKSPEEALSELFLIIDGLGILNPNMQATLRALAGPLTEFLHWLYAPEGKHHRVSDLIAAEMEKEFPGEMEKAKKLFDQLAAGIKPAGKTDD